MGDASPASGHFVTLFKVFVSSSNEVKAERDIVRDVIAAQNRSSHARDHEYRLEPLLWEDGRVPAAAGEPQEVVDRYLGRVEEASIFVCILGPRLGEGTEKELRRAIRSNLAHRYPKVAFYLCESPKCQSVEESMQKLREELMGPEHLVKAYDSEEAFRRYVSDDIDIYAGELVAGGTTRKPTLRASRAPQLDAFGEHMLAQVESTWLAGSDAEEEGLIARFVEWGTPETAGRHVNPENLVRAYEEHGSQLVILGEPGGGKSRALLLLLEGLLNNSESDEAQGMIPVVVSAASWSEEYADVDSWLEEEFRSFYNLGRWTKRLLELIDQKRVILMVDGLDEVDRVVDVDAPLQLGEVPRIQDFVLALNDWIARMPSRALVVTCQREAYEKLEEKLIVESPPIYIRPLDEEAIDAVLLREELKSLRAEFPRHSDLQELARTPFWLRTMSIVYAKKGPGFIGTQPSTEARKEHVLGKYVDHCLDKGARSSTFAGSLPEKRDWLAWLATKLRTTSAESEEGGGTKRTMLLVEKITPDWLPGSERTFSTYALAAGSLLAAFLTIFAGVPCSLALAYELIAWRGSVVDGLLLGLTSGLCTGLLGGSVVLLGFCLARGPALAVAVGLALGAARGFLIGMSLSDDGSTVMGLERGLWDGLVTSAIAGPGAYFIFKYQEYQREKVDPVEAVDERWYRHWKRGLVGLPVGIVVALTFGLQRDWGRGAAFGLALGVLVTSVGVFSGISLPSKVRPNQGIIQSRRHAVRMGITMAVVGAVAFGGSYGAAQDLSQQQGQIAAVVNGLLGLVLFVVALFFGALPVIKHYGMRIALWRKGVAPLQLVAFLEHVVELGLMRRVGGSYVFVHDSLRGYLDRWKIEKDQSSSRSADRRRSRLSSSARS